MVSNASPWKAIAVWRTVEPFIDRTTASKVVLLPVASKPGAPCPQELGEYVSYWEIHEDRRHRHTSLLDLETENAAPNQQEQHGRR